MFFFVPSVMYHMIIHSCFIYKLHIRPSPLILKFQVLAITAYCSQSNCQILIVRCPYLAVPTCHPLFIQFNHTFTFFSSLQYFLGYPYRDWILDCRAAPLLSQYHTIFQLSLLQFLISYCLVSRVLSSLQ
jgi:hypothetical protein